MAENKTEELRQRRTELSNALPTLSRNRDHTYRLNSDALALERAGVTRHAPDELARLQEGQTVADAAIRDAHCQIRDLDAEIGRASGGGFGARVARVVRRPRSSSQ